MEVYSIKEAVGRIEEDLGLEYKIAMRGMYDIEADLEKLGYEHDPEDGDNTNGWEVDFWYKFVHPEKGAVAVSGGLWQRGNTYTIYKANKEE